MSPYYLEAASYMPWTFSWECEPPKPGRQVATRRFIGRDTLVHRSQANCLTLPPHHLPQLPDWLERLGSTGEESGSTFDDLTRLRAPSTAYAEIQGGEHDEALTDAAAVSWSANFGAYARLLVDVPLEARRGLQDHPLLSLPAHARDLARTGCRDSEGLPYQILDLPDPISYMAGYCPHLAR